MERQPWGRPLLVLSLRLFHGRVEVLANKVHKTSSCGALGALELSWMPGLLTPKFLFPDALLEYFPKPQDSHYRSDSTVLAKSSVCLCLCHVSNTPSAVSFYFPFGIFIVQSPDWSLVFQAPMLIPGRVSSHRKSLVSPV